MSSKGKALSETGKRRLQTLLNRLIEFRNYKQIDPQTWREFEKKKRGKK